MPDFFEVLRTRRSVRSYTPQPLSDEEVRELIADAILAPNGMNAQPWAFSVVTDEPVLARLNAIILERLRSPEVMARFDERLRQIVSDPSYTVFYGAPVLIVIFGDERSPVAVNDCHLAAENLFLSAHARGLGTCYMGFLLMVRDHPQVRELLRVPGGFSIMAAAIAGHPASAPEEPPRRDPPRIEWVRNS